MNALHTSVWAYDYDEGGNRISKRVALLPISGTDTSWTPVRKYVYDGVNMVADSGQVDSNWNQYAFLGYKRFAWVSQDSGVRVRYIGSDHLGTANLLLDNAGGILSRYVLDPWGNVEYAKETAPLRYLYTGKESDAEAGGMVTYINARYLDNERGMWLGRDPAEEFYTPYGYVGNGANETIDPSGLVGEMANGLCMDRSVKDLTFSLNSSSFNLSEAKLNFGYDSHVEMENNIYDQLPDGTFYGGVNAAAPVLIGYVQYEFGAFYDASASEKMIAPYQSYGGAIGKSSLGLGATIGYFRGGSQQNFAGLSIPVNVGPVSVYLSSKGSIVGASLSTSPSFVIGRSNTVTFLPVKMTTPLPTTYKPAPAPADATKVRFK